MTGNYKTLIAKYRFKESSVKRSADIDDFYGFEFI